jgi:hypothetical protein
MRTYTAVAASPDDTHVEDSVVHAWRVSQLIRLGLAMPVADAVADEVDWHAVARLVERGCPAALAAAIVQ